MSGPIAGVGGIVLCGGRSSRMGRPKAWLPFGEELLLQRVVRILGEVVSPIVVVAAADQTIPPLPVDVLIARDEQEYLGPLNGLAAGLTALTGLAQVAYLSSCDVPFLRADFIRRVIERMETADISIPDIGGYRHPLAAAYRIGVLPFVKELVAAGRLRPVFLTDSRPTRILQQGDLKDVDPDMQSLRNVNTPEEYEAALRDAASMSTNQ